ncbi:unnamed protein product [Cylicostephanus goldi]|uniref:ubiquitinyl hydrolase 1 n=1 Tax=Cylicostephanus goldi TaxID=71465 RepID=A0A3P7PVA0_CYLGO|nr:unnamed protein product [Cylicostephanus goldi]
MQITFICFRTCQFVINATSAERIALLQNASNAWDGEVRVIFDFSLCFSIFELLIPTSGWVCEAENCGLNENLWLNLTDGAIRCGRSQFIPTSGWVCEAENCGLNENLWLNLTDGAIRCGRSQFVGEGQMCKGNNHMKQYFDATGFPLVVKLGTISSDGTADVFSYDEDDAVIDPNLEKHLAHFGIDARSLKKTEKSTLELELDMNQKWEWAKCQEDGASLENIYGPGYTGLINLGSSCYMNSVSFQILAPINKIWYFSQVLQSLLLVPSFVTRYVDGAGPILARVPPLDVHTDFNGQVAKLFSAMSSGDYSAENSDLNGIKPSQFKRVVAGNHPEFSTSRQQDAEEYIRFLLDKISSGTPVEVRDPTLSVKFVQNGKPIRRYCFRYGEVHGQGRNCACSAYPQGGRSNVALTDCLHALFEPEIIEDFVSPITNERKGARTTIRFKTFPDFLFLQAQVILLYNK